MQHVAQHVAQHVEPNVALYAEIWNSGNYSDSLLVRHERLYFEMVHSIVR